jgi:sarcosine oxidase
VTRSFDVLVVGLGGAGSQVALRLARRGARVCGLDRHRPPHTLGSSHGRTRIIREAYFEEPLFVPLVRRSYELWAELERESGRELYRQTSGLMIGPRDGVLVEGARASARQHELEHELLDAAEMRRRFPAFELRDDDVAVLEPRAGILRPEAAIEATLELAAAAGAELRLDEPVLGWTRDGDGVAVQLAHETLQADRLVIAAGPWVAQLVPELARSVALTRQPVLWFAPTPGRESLVRPESLPIFLLEWQPGWMLYGFPDEGEGVKVAQHQHGEATTMDTIDRSIRDDDVELVRDLVARFVPAANGELRDASVCVYTNTPDELFVVDALPDAPQVIVLSPCSGHGFKFMPALGEAVAALALGEGPEADLSPFALARLR